MKIRTGNKLLNEQNFSHLLVNLPAPIIKMLLNREGLKNYFLGTCQQKGGGHILRSQKEMFSNVVKALKSTRKQSKIFFERFRTC